MNTFRSWMAPAAGRRRIISIALVLALAIGVCGAPRGASERGPLPPGISVASDPGGGSGNGGG